MSANTPVSRALLLRLAGTLQQPVGGGAAPSSMRSDRAMRSTSKLQSAALGGPGMIFLP